MRGVFTQCQQLHLGLRCAAASDIDDGIQHQAQIVPQATAGDERIYAAGGGYSFVRDMRPVVLSDFVAVKRLQRVHEIA